MFADGRRLDCPVQLGDNLESVSVRLRYAGFGIGLKQEIIRPQLWFDHANAFARYNAKAGTLEVVERIQALAMRAGESHARRLVWLDLPEQYCGKTIEEIDIEAHGSVSIAAIDATRVLVNTWADIAIHGLRIGETGFFKTVQGNITVEKLVASQDGDPHYRPTAELIALTGTAFISESKASWRLYGREIVAPDPVGPVHSCTL